MANEAMKKRLRSNLIKKRNALTPRQVAEKSALITSRLLALEEYCRAGSVMVYLDWRNEVRTGDLVTRALADGKRVAAPVTDPAQRLLTPSLIVNYPAGLQPGAWGIPEPRPVRPLDPAALDLVITPGAAFDLAGYRIGYGYGFYDRFLRRTGEGAIYIGLAYDFQVLPDVCPEPHDIPVHIIITESRLIRLQPVNSI